MALFFECQFLIYFPFPTSPSSSCVAFLHLVAAFQKGHELQFWACSRCPLPWEFPFFKKREQSSPSVQCKTATSVMRRVLENRYVFFVIFFWLACARWGILVLDFSMRAINKLQFSDRIPVQCVYIGRSLNHSDSLSYLARLLLPSSFSLLSVMGGGLWRSYWLVVVLLDWKLLKRKRKHNCSWLQSWCHW